METLKFNVFNFLNKSKKTTVPLVLLRPTFPYVQNCLYIDAISVESFQDNNRPNEQHEIHISKRRYSYTKVYSKKLLR